MPGIYRNIYSCLRSDFLFILTVLLSVATYIAHRIVRSDTDISQYLAYYEACRPLYDNTFSFIFFENMQAMLQTVCIVLIPFFLGSLFCLFFTADSLVASLKYIIAETSVSTLIIGTLPHGIFEIPAMIFSVILGAIISKELTLFLLSVITKKKFDNPKFVLHRNGIGKTAVFVLESMVFVLLPLVFSGAFAETFITGRIPETFFGFQQGFTETPRIK